MDAHHRRWQLLYQLGLVVVGLSVVLLVQASVIRREVSLLFIAAWSFIFGSPLVQVLTQRFAGLDLDGYDEPEEEVSYRLSGSVVKPQERQKLKSHGTELDQSTREQWFYNHKDKHWYQCATGNLSFCRAVFQAVLNIYAIVITSSRTLDPDDRGWAGKIVAVSIEVPYMFLFLLPYFLYTAVKLGRRFSCRGWLGGTLRDCRGEGQVVVQFSASLKSLGRFSALNFLEDGLAPVLDRRHQLLKMISSIFGLLVLHGKIGELTFIVNQREFNWTLEQWIRVVAFLNNGFCVVEKRDRMIAVAIDTKYYRKDRWLDAVGDHLVEAVGGDHRSLDPLGIANSARGYEMLYHVLKRFVSMGPKDVNRLIEDLIIERSQSDTGPRPTIRRIPKQISDDCWNGQLTNFVGVVRVGLFRALANKVSAPPERILLQGAVGRIAEAQKEMQETRAEAQKVAQEKAAAIESANEKIEDLEDQIKQLQAQMIHSMHTSSR